MLSVLKAGCRAIGAVARTAGAALDTVGLSLQGDLAPRDKLMPVINRLPYNGTKPTIGQDAFVAPNAAVIGDVTIGNQSSVWYGATLRGDVNSIRIGNFTNIQDRAVVHVARHNPEGRPLPTIIGDEVTIGHGAIIHACTIEDQVLIGMGAKVLDGAVVRRGAIVAAGSLVTPNTEIPSGEVWLGSPAKYSRDLTEAETAFLSHSAQGYAQLAGEHLEENTKVFLAVMNDDLMHEDLEFRNPEHDYDLGIERDVDTREIISAKGMKGGEAT